MALRKLCFSTKATQHFDVIITGGGLIGSAMACALSKSSFLPNTSILLLENNAEKPWSLPPNYSNRVISLNNSTKKFLSSLGAWKIIEAARLKEVKGMKVWSDSPNVALSFDASENNSNAISHIVENDLVINSVMDLLKKENKVTILNCAKVKDYTLPKGNEAVSVLLNNGTEFKCNLLIGADGANSKVRKTMGCKYLSWDYKQLAIVATLELEGVAPNNIAWQRFIPTGPIALLPLTDTLSSLVWSTTVEKANNLLKIPNDSFVDALNSALSDTPKPDSPVEFCSELTNKFFNFLHLAPSYDGPISPPFVKNVVNGSRVAFPLSFGHSVRYVANRTALVGDAAHKVHPLAGQGVNLGFADIVSLVDKLEESISLGEEFGKNGALFRYETERQRVNTPIMFGIDLVHKLYGSQNPALQIITNLSWQVANNVNPIKKLLMQQAA